MDLKKILKKYNKLNAVKIFWKKYETRDTTKKVKCAV